MLRKALYGLRQSPQLFSKLLDELLNSCGMRRCVHEACIYKYYDADGWVLIGAEVDDLIVTGTNIKKMAELQQLFQDKWGVEKWGDIHTFLGMRCKYDRSAGELTLDVEQKIKDMLKRFPELAKLPAIQDRSSSTCSREQRTEGWRIETTLGHRRVHCCRVP